MLMESDTLISRIDIDTDRLLSAQSEKPNEVHLVIEVSINVLTVTPYNTCLLCVTSRKVIWLISEQLWLQFVPALHRLQGCLAAKG